MLHARKHGHNILFLSDSVIGVLRLMVMNRLNRYDSHNLFDLPITINKREIATRCACMWQEFNIERTIHKKLSVISQMFIRNICKISLVKSPCPNQERKSKGRNKWFCSRIWYIIFKIFVCHYSTECKIKLIHWGKQDWFGISGEKPKTAFRAFFTDMDMRNWGSWFPVNFHFLDLFLLHVWE